MLFEASWRPHPQGLLFFDSLKGQFASVPMTSPLQFPLSPWKGSELREKQSLVEESLGNGCISTHEVNLAHRQSVVTVYQVGHGPSGGDGQDRGSVSWEKWVWEEPEDPQKDEDPLLPLGAQSDGES